MRDRVKNWKSREQEAASMRDEEQIYQYPVAECRVYADTG